jgi:tRNA(His) guanylyltransferase
MNDSLGDRMKENYEDRTRHFLPRRTNTVIRIDGKAFHTYTKHLNRPYDDGLMEDMQNTTIALCEDIQGAKFGYTQSDEISLFLTDYDQLGTCAWFDGNIQKIASVSASIATGEFNQFRIARGPGDPLINHLHKDYILSLGMARFDSRVFTIAEQAEVANYFLWRMQDAARNSVQMFARSFFSHKELNNKSIPEIHDMLHGIGQNWAHLSPEKKNGTLVWQDLRNGDWIKYNIPAIANYQFWSDLVTEVTTKPVLG